METNLIGEMDMLRGMGVRPSFSEMARRYGMDRHAVAKCWKEGAGMGGGRPARRSGFDGYRDETGTGPGCPASRRRRCTSGSPAGVRTGSPPSTTPPGTGWMHAG